MTANGNTRATAEAYLDEMLEAEKNLDYDAFTRRFEPQYIVNFSESKFQKDMHSIRYDLGNYQCREFMGSLNGFEDRSQQNKYPGNQRYVWKGVFEKN